MIISKKLKKKLHCIENLEIKIDEPLKEHTSFKIGGPADIFLIPANINALKEVLPLIKDIPIFILGKGSNIIVGDKGFRGIVISTENLNNFEVKGEKIIVQTGITLSELAEVSLENRLTGLEFASGIPGTLGGALYMNAGAYGGEMKDIITEVTCLNSKGEQITFTKEELELSYRHSILQEKPLIAVEVRLTLKSGNKEEIKAKIDELTEKRWAKQPMEIPSAGSAFKRPEGHYAGALIDEAGLKGTRVGDAQVSKKHAGFIVNLGQATAQDIKRLIKKIQTEVYNKSGVKLEPEPRFIGEFLND